MSIKHQYTGTCQKCGATIGVEGRAGLGTKTGICYTQLTIGERKFTCNARVVLYEKSDSEKEN